MKTCRVVYDSVKSQFTAFNKTFEGSISYMYLDIKGLVTIGVGNLIDPVSEAVILPFCFKANPAQFAAQSDIQAEWTLLKSKPELAKQGYTACAPLTKLQLNDDAINALIDKRLLQNETILKKSNAFKNFDQWPADAQLGLLSMAWAMGPDFSPSWPKFSAACAKMDFTAAANDCQMNEAGNPGLVPRNKANQQLFINAAKVLAGEASGQYQRETLYYKVP